MIPLLSQIRSSPKRKNNTTRIQVIREKKRSSPHVSDTMFVFVLPLELVEAKEQNPKMETRQRGVNYRRLGLRGSKIR